MISSVVEYREETVVSVRITEDVKRRVDKLRLEHKCTGCEEVVPDGEPIRCGQCTRCYNLSLRKIERKEVTRSELIRKGLMLPPGKPGRKPASSTYEQKLAEL